MYVKPKTDQDGSLSFEGPCSEAVYHSVTDRRVVSVEDGEVGATKNVVAFTKNQAFSIYIWLQDRPGITEHRSGLVKIKVGGVTYDIDAAADDKAKSGRGNGSPSGVGCLSTKLGL